MKFKISLILASALLFSCGTESSDSQTKKWVNANDEKVNNVEISCEEEDGQRNIEVTATLEQLNIVDNVKLMSLLDGDQNFTNFEYLMDERKIIAKRSFANDIKDVQLLVYIENAIMYGDKTTKKVVKMISENLDLLCSDNYEEAKRLQELAEAINNSSENLKPGMDLCNLPLPIGALGDICSPDKRKFQ